MALLLSSQPINLDDFSIWSVLIQIAILLSILLVANTLRRKISFINKSLLPAAVIAGLLMLLIRQIPFFNNLIDDKLMQIVTYHTFALGFIALTLKTTVKKMKKSDKIAVVDTGVMTVSTYIVQGIVGVVLMFLLSLLFFPDLFIQGGLLLPMGYGQGPGQAFNWGNIYETQWGFNGGTSFGLSIASLGFLFACIGGVIYLNIKRKKHKIKTEATETNFSNEEILEGPNDIPLTESVDRITIQMALVFSAFLISFLMMFGLGELSKLLGDFGVNTIVPLIWGFNFLFGIIAAIIIKNIINLLRKKKIMKRDYPNNFLLNRIGGFMFDLMIISGIAGIDISVLSSLIVPLIVICCIGGIVTLYYVEFICKRCFPSHWLEMTVSFYGMLTGTASTGMILLREIDPSYKTPTADYMVYQNIPAIILALPILLIMGIAPKPGMIWWMVAVLVILFILFNVYLLRKNIFKKKYKNNINNNK